MTFEAVLFQQAQRLAQGGIEDGRLEARLLLLHIMEWEPSDLILRGKDAVPPQTMEQYHRLIERREQGEPVFRIIGKREFHGLMFELGPDTLEPRDDTEALVELVLETIKDRNQPVRLADLGTGTGALAIALLSELPNATAVMTDLNRSALEVAYGNAERHGMRDRVNTAQGSWFEALDEDEPYRFDFIVSNPPYIRTNIVTELAPEVQKYDPLLALDGGADGLDAYRAILKTAKNHLLATGFLALEIGYDQKQALIDLALQSGWHVTRAKQDLGGNDRALLLEMVQ